MLTELKNVTDDKVSSTTICNNNKPMITLPCSRSLVSGYMPSHLRYHETGICRSSSNTRQHTVLLCSQKNQSLNWAFDQCSYFINGVNGKKNVFFWKSRLKNSLWFNFDLVLVLEEVKVMNHLIISILIPVQSKVCYCYILLLFPFVPCTLDVPWYYQLYPYKGSGGNKKLPPCRFSTVGIVRKVPSTLTQLPTQTSSPWWCRLPLLRCGICESAQSNAGNLFRRGWPRALTLGLI